jgi:uncharacterized cupin superfamily protein
MPKLDLEAIEATNRTGYPPPFDATVAGRWVRRLGETAGFTDFGASHVTLEPGAASSQRHWHEEEDELVVMLSGEAVLHEDEGATTMKPGDIAIFPKGRAHGHHLVNRSDRPCSFIAIGRKPVGTAHYSDIDLVWEGRASRYTRKDGTPY